MAERGGFEPAVRYAHATLHGSEQRRNFKDDRQLRRLLRAEGQEWIEDPSNGMKAPDNYGGLNSVVVVG